MRQTIQERRAEAVAAGLCRNCFKNLATHGKCCDVCHEKRQQRARQNARAKYLSGDPVAKEKAHDRNRRCYARRKYGLVSQNDHAEKLTDNHYPAYSIAIALYDGTRTAKQVMAMCWTEKMVGNENYSLQAKLEPDKYSILPQFRHLVAKFKEK